MTAPFETSGDLPVRLPGAPAELAEHLLDVACALQVWEAARDIERERMQLLVAAIETARQHGEPLQRIADLMGGRTRQYVQKLLRRAETEAAALEADHRALNAAAERDYRRDKEGIGQVNCGSCGCFKSLPSSVCSQCGDEPGTYNGDHFETDEAYYGHRVLR